MQNISISLVTSSATDVSSVKTTKANDNTFENFMLNHGAKVKQVHRDKKADSNIVSPEQTNNRDVASRDYKTNKDVVKSDKSDLRQNDKSEKMTQDSADTSEMTEISDEALGEAAAEIVSVIQQAMQFPEEIVQDVWNQVEPDTDMLAAVINGQDITPVAADFAKEFVMETHGITDPAAFLTNDTLNGELNQMVEVMERLPETFDKPEILQTMSEENLPDQEMDVTKVQEDGILPTEETSMPQVQVIVSDKNSSDAGHDSDEKEEPGELSQTSFETDTMSNEILRDNLNVFTKNLTEALETTTQNTTQEQTTLYGITPQQLVEQVVEQVKVRVMPETTDLELQLHPESLGRVNVHVSAASQGVTRAVITVENQFAKEALEGQLIVLKQNFEEQGLKVDSVEVTVSEFGLNGEQRDAGEEQQKGSKGKRQFDAEAGLEEDEDNSQETSSSRRDVDSTVDYTA